MEEALQGEDVFLPREEDEHAARAPIGLRYQAFDRACGGGEVRVAGGPQEERLDEMPAAAEVESGRARPEVPRHACRIERGGHYQ